MAKGLSVAIVAIALAVVIMLGLGGVTGKSAVAACNSDAETVETAIAAFHIDNPTLAPTPSLLTSASRGGPFLASWPKNGSHYSISVTSRGTVMVSAPAAAPARDYDTHNPCPSAS